MVYRVRSYARSRGLWLGLLATFTASLTLVGPAVHACFAAGDDPPPIPAAPAFYTASLSRIQSIGPAEFGFEDDAGHRILIRLASADCSKVYERQQGLATTVMKSALQAEPVWVFPWGAEKGGEVPVVHAHVWTSKGWLAERLIKAGYAMRREGLDAASLDPPPEVKVDPEKARPPAGGAYASPALTSAGGGVFEVECSGRAVKVRLFDAACEGESSEVTEAASGCLDGKPVWVFPCSAAARGLAPVRIWTAKGWIHDRLIARSLAKRHENPYKPGVEMASGSTTPTYPPPSQRTTTGTETPGKPKFKWRKVTVTLSGRDTSGLTLTRNVTRLHVQTDRFEIASPVMRITWDMEPVFKNNAVVLNVFKIRESGIAANVVHSCTGKKGQQLVQRGPGTYYIRVTSPQKMNLTVEEAVPAD